MRIGLAYNEKPDVGAASDDYAEWDDPSTIDAVDQALSLFGTVVRLEADEFFPQKLRSEEHTSELQSHHDLVCRLLLEKKKNETTSTGTPHEYSNGSPAIARYPL